MGVQVHLKQYDGSKSKGYARIEDIVDKHDVVIHSNGGCHKKGKENFDSIDYNQAINKPKINGHTLIGDMSSEELGLPQKQNAYKEISRVKKYLYEVYYDRLDYDWADAYFLTEKPNSKISGACSAVRKGNLYGRNFDWVYDENAEFLVRTPHMNNRFAVMGISTRIPGLTDDIVMGGQYNEIFNLVPFKLVDGINEKGLIINTNVVPTDKGVNKKTIPNIEEKISICSSMVPRYVLDHFSTARGAAEYLRDYASIYPPKDIVRMGYEPHYMIADANETYLMEVIDNHVVITNMTEGSNSHLANKPYMTNFYLSDVVLNDDGRVYTPEYRDGEKNAITYNKITENGGGLERYNIIAESYRDLEDKEDMGQLLKKLKYTNSYRTATDPRWYSEFCGINGLNVISTSEEFEPVFEGSSNIFKHRSRKEDSKYYGTWQTTHSAIYDIENKKLYLIIQEDGEEAEYTYDALTPESSGGTTNYEDLDNKPKINGVELIGNVEANNLNIKTSDLENDSGFITSAVANLINYYKKTELYNREEIDEMFSEITKFSVEVVNSVEEVIHENTIYYVKNIGVDGYSEYYIIDGVPTKIAGSIINDTVVSLESTYSSEKIEERLKDASGAPIIEGTVDKPIIASNLKLGVYVLSGIVQSSEENLTIYRIIDKAVYLVMRDGEQTTLWTTNPYLGIIDYIIFKHEGRETPQSGSYTPVTIDVVEEKIRNALIDGGIFN